MSLQAALVSEGSWPRAPLKELVTIAQGGFASGERSSDGIVQIRMNNVTANGSLDWTKLTRVPTSPKQTKEYELVRGDIVFNNTNSTELVGKTAYFPGYAEAVVFSNHFTRLRVKEDVLDPQFLALWLQRLWRQRVFAEICDRWIGQSAVQREKLLSLSVPLPPIKEQKRISAMLNEQMENGDFVRSQVASQLKFAESITTSILSTEFESAESNARARRTIGEIAKTASGATPPRGNSAYFSGGTIPWVKTGELKDSSIASSEEYVTDLALKDCSLPLLPVGTLLIAMYGQGQTRGRTGLLAIPATTNQACFAILPNPGEFESRYLQYWFRHSYQRLRRETEGRGGNQPNLNGILLRSLEVPLPPLKDQNAIAARLDQKFSVVNIITEDSNLVKSAIDSFPAALLRQAFSGAN